MGFYNILLRYKLLCLSIACQLGNQECLAEAKRQFSIWKNSADAYEKNPIDPDYQAAIIGFGIDNKEDLEFLQNITKLEKEKENAWNDYKTRLAIAAQLYNSYKEKPKQKNATETETEIETENFRIER